MDSPAGGRGGALEVAVLGFSLQRTCGVRDHAEILADALAAQNVSCTRHWLLRDERSLRGSRAEIGSFIGGLPRALAEVRPDAILLHYSVFTYSHKGVPVFVAPLLSALRSSGVPVVSFLHEFVYPWGYGGWRGVAWAVSQRAALVELMRRTRSAIVTDESRAAWLTSRRWLPTRPVLTAPVFSNLPAPSGSPRPQRTRPAIGLFGYSYQGAATAIVLDALDELQRTGIDAELILLGAPGAASPAGESWQAQARARGVQDSLSFSGRLPAQSLSDELASCEVLLFADRAGPSPRKGTLAGSLASGRPVLALDGPRAWPALLSAQAVGLVESSAAALARRITMLLADAGEREALGTRGLAFARSEMSVERAAAVTRSALELAVLPGRRASGR